MIDQRQADTCSPWTAFLWNLVPLPVGLGYVYLSLHLRTGYSIAIRLAGYAGSLIAALVVHDSQCGADTDCSTAGEALAIVIGVNLTISLVSAIDAFRSAQAIHRIHHGDIDSGWTWERVFMRAWFRHDGPLVKVAVVVGAVAATGLLAIAVLAAIEDSFGLALLALFTLLVLPLLPDRFGR